ncbi:MAG: hypothetical protein GXO34_07060, partial [Deltaproteobacteria bacterium]|nr:hypothetical protein [Deltaproteobacteria bacterium]
MMKKRLSMALFSGLLILLLLPGFSAAAGQVKRYTFNIAIGNWDILP